MIDVETQDDTPEDELRRAEHLVYVSLKYTRTRDVMLNAIKRMVSAYELGFHKYLKSKIKSGCIKEIPQTINEKSVLVKSMTGSKTKKHFILYSLLKRIEKSRCEGEEEFRKNVTLIAKPKIGNAKDIRVKTKDLEEFLAVTKEFVLFLRSESKWQEQ